MPGQTHLLKTQAYNPNPFFIAAAMLVYPLLFGWHSSQLWASHHQAQGGYVCKRHGKRAKGKRGVRKEWKEDRTNNVLVFDQKDPLAHLYAPRKREHVRTRVRLGRTRRWVRVWVQHPPHDKEEGMRKGAAPSAGQGGGNEGGCSTLSRTRWRARTRVHRPQQNKEEGTRTITLSEALPWRWPTCTKQGT
jgi:hypothetical protein